MYVVYLLLEPERGKLYIGVTRDLKRRLLEHQGDKPKYKLFYAEAYFSKRDAQIREKNLKKFKSAYHNLKRRLRYSFLEFNEGGGRSERAPATV